MTRLAGWRVSACRNFQAHPPRAEEGSKQAAANAWRVGGKGVGSYQGAHAHPDHPVAPRNQRRRNAIRSFFVHGPLHLIGEWLDQVGKCRSFLGVQEDLDRHAWHQLLAVEATVIDDRDC